VLRGANWHIEANTTELSVFNVDVALYQITCTTCFICFYYLSILLLPVVLV